MTLREFLNEQTWRTLRAIAYAHEQSFDSQLPKEEATEYILDLLTDHAHMESVLSSLPSDAEEALQTLLACGGEMPAHRFTKAFGPIRAFRPWQGDSPHRPWRDPASPGERLWFLGLLFFRTTSHGETVVVPDGLRALIPGNPLPTITPLTHPPSSRLDPVLDLVHLLAYSQGHDVRPFAGRWFTPQHLQAINVGLAHPDPAVEEARSELQTGYLRFLHYLAETSGFLDVVGGLLKPMPAAWRWLDEPEPKRWGTLWGNWQADLNPQPGKESLWRRYRFPGHPAFAGTVLDSLRSLASDQPLQNAATDLPLLATYVQRRCIGAGTLPQGNDVLTLLRALVSGPLSWGCIANTDSADRLSLTSLGARLLESGKGLPQPPTTEGATIRDNEDYLVVILPKPPLRPPMAPLVTLGMPSKDRLTRHLTRQRFVSLLATGVERPGITETLRVLTTDDLPRNVVERLKTWEEQARGLTIRPLTVLTVADVETLDRLTDQRRIRDLFLETLSPHHIAVDPSQVERLLRFLRQCGRTPLVEPGAVPRHQSSHGTFPDNGAAAHLWLALRTYLDLSNLVPLPAVPPVALLDQLERLIDENELAELAFLADQVHERLRELLDGYSAFPAPLADVDRGEIESTVERALEEAHPIEIVYHTAGRGARTRRVVEPVRLDEYDGARYLIAYCRLRHEERVFRLDRIEAAVELDQQ